MMVMGNVIGHGECHWSLGKSLVNGHWSFKEVIGHGKVIGQWSMGKSLVMGNVIGQWSFKEVIGQWSLVIDKSIVRGFFGLRHVLIWLVKKKGLEVKK